MTHDIVSSTSFLEQLEEIKSRPSLSAGQIADLFGVTRKSVYDWLEGSAPLPGISCRMSSLVNALAVVPAGMDLQRLKTVWNIPVSGQSFRSAFLGDYSDAALFQAELKNKLHELSSQMTMKTGAPSKTAAQFGKSHLAEFDKTTDFS